MSEVRRSVDPAERFDGSVFHYSIPSIQATGDGQLEPASEIGSTKLQITGPTLLVSKLNPRKGVVLEARVRHDVPTVCSSEFICLLPKNCHLRFASYLFQSEQVRQQLDGLVKSATRSHQRIQPSDITKLWLRWPPLPTQRAIAAFLDRETAKIDALIEKKRRLLDLLDEKRTALITRAVTRGLDPDVSMKDSGVEWLGEIPAHWRITKIGLRFSVQLGKMLDQSEITGEELYPYLRVADVQWGKINVEDLPRMDFSPADRRRYALREGDLLVNEGGSYVGRSAIWEDKIADCFYQKALHRVRSRSDRDTTRFLYYVMRFATEHGVFVAGGNQTTIDHLTAEQLRRYRFAFPPRSEQEKIADLLDSWVAQMEQTATRVRDAISLLEEYRTALVSAAITGQIAVSETAA